MTLGKDAEQSLSEWMEEGTLILGIGNPLRGDDAAGPAVCAALDTREAVDCSDAPERYLGLAGEAGVTRVLLVDAVGFGGEPGAVAFLLPRDLRERFGTTHDSGLALLCRFLEGEHKKPTALLGIQPLDTRFGAEMHADVRAATEKVAAWLRRGLEGRKEREVEAAWSRR